MFNLIKEYHQKCKKLINVQPQTNDQEKLKQEVLTNVGVFYNELYYNYKSKYNKKIDTLSVKNKNKV